MSRGWPKLDWASLVDHEPRRLAPGSWFKPRVGLAVLGGRRIVVKDYRGTWLWVRRTIGRWAVHHEARVLHALETVQGVPRLLGVMDGDGLALEWIEGERLELALAPRLPEAFFDELEAVLMDVHAEGWAHGDLSNRRNVVLGSDGRAWIVDFGAALPMGRGPRLRRWRCALQQIDRWGLLKNKERYRPEQVTPEERRDLARRASWRRWWIFG
ncbi:MAG: hypothetical protein RL885_07725 [Planctomycetota bacterium]